METKIETKLEKTNKVKFKFNNSIGDDNLAVQEITASYYKDNKTIHKTFTIKGKKTELDSLTELLKRELTRPIEIRGCHRLIPRGKWKRSKDTGQINKMLAQVKSNSSYSNSIKEQILKLEEWINNNPIGYNFTTTDFKKATGLQLFGDVSKAPLDLQVCRGKLKKLRFSCGRKGNKYEITNNEPCEFFVSNEDIEYCKCEEWNVMKEEKEE